jgi:cell division transport system permease protein
MNIHLKTALGHIRRTPFQALAAFFVLSITFFVITILSVTAYSSNQLIKYFETRPQVIAFLKDSTEGDQITSLQDKLKSDIRIKEIKYITKEEALEIYKKATSDNPLLSELVSPSIFPSSLEFSLTNLSFAQSIIEEVKKESIVDSVGFTASLGGEETLSDVVDRLKTVSNYVKIGGGAFAVLLTATSLLVLMVIIGMRMTARRGEIEILDLIGATPGFIRSPIILEALTYVIAGVFTGWLFAFLLILYASPNLISYFGEIPVLPHGVGHLFALFGLILLAEFLAGIVLALFGSFLAVSRVKKAK